MNRNRITLFALLFLLVFNVLVPVLHAQLLSEMTETERNQKIKDAIEKRKKERAKFQHPKVSEMLVELEEEYNKGAEEWSKRFAAGEALKDENGNAVTTAEDASKKGGIAAAKKFARIHKLSLVDEKYIFVEITFKPGITGETFDATQIEKLGGRINARGYKMDAYIPIHSIRNIADKIDEIQLIELPHPIKLLNIQSEGLRNIGFSNYSGAGIRGQNVKVGVIDKGFA